MAKHDQKILKFLNQNRSGSTTIIDLMTKLNINIADVSDSLSGLLAQGVVSKRTNSDGMECWSVATEQVATTETSIPHLQPIRSTSSLSGLNASGGIGTMGIQSAVNSAVLEIPNQPEKSSTQTTSLSPQTQSATLPEPVTEVETKKVLESETPIKPSLIEEAGQARIPSTPPYLPMPIYPGNSSKGIGVFPFILGLAIVAALSIWVGIQLNAKALQRSTKSLVSQEAFTEFQNSSKEFEGKTKVHMAALEDQMKLMGEELATMQTLTDSLKLALEAAQTKLSKNQGKASPTTSKARRNRIR